MAVTNPMRSLGLTEEEFKALAVLLSGGVSVAALEKLGLEHVQKVMRSQYAELPKLSEYSCWDKVK